MKNIERITLEVLRSAVEGDAVGVRSITRLQPAAGPGSKVFPPTYAVDRGAPTKYAMENRRVDGRDVQAVLLDSVASQANRMEEALLSAWEEREIDVPVISVDFSGVEGIADLGKITALQTPHRIADALLRDSIDDAGRRFRDTAIGRSFTDASVKNATAVYLTCPTALVFGVWDSTGPRGGLGNKFQRALVSEIIAIGAVPGVATKSRLDPAGIQANVSVFHRMDDRDDWTIDESEAYKEKGKFVPFSRTGAEGKGNPSAVNHSNVAPSIDTTSGGVTFDYAQQTTVLSFPALRRLRFPSDAEGNAVPNDRRREMETAARTALAALALLAVVQLRDRGFDLRSRSFLVPEDGGPFTLELLPSTGGEARRFQLSPGDAADLLREASAEAARMGLPWNREPLVLKPAPKLAALIRESRKRAAAGAADERETAD